MNFARMLISVVAVFDPANYRGAGAESHKPNGKGKEKIVSEEDRLKAFVWHGMETQAENGNDIWSDSYSVNAITWVDAIKFGIVTVKKWRDYVASFADDSPQAIAWGGKNAPLPEVLLNAGHCRTRTAFDVAIAHSVPIVELTIPVVVKPYTSAAEFYQDQVGDNELSTEGVVKTTALDKYRAARRAVLGGFAEAKRGIGGLKDKAGIPSGADQDAIFMLQVEKRFPKNAIFGRLTMPKPKIKEGESPYKAGGHIPQKCLKWSKLQDILAPLTEAEALERGTADSAKGYKKILADLKTAKTEFITEFEAFVCRTLEGTEPSGGVCSKKQWEAFAACEPGSLGAMLHKSHIAGVGFAQLFGTYGEVLGDTELLARLEKIKA